MILIEFIIVCKIFVSACIKITLSAETFVKFSKDTFTFAWRNHQLPLASWNFVVFSILVFGFYDISISET